jgi:hypothetical protein
MGMSCFYIIAWIIIHRMMGDLETVTLGTGKTPAVSLAPSRA